MKPVLAFSLSLALTFATAATAEELDPEAQAAPAKKDCPLCKLPGRAALFAGNAKTCPPGCAKLCCTGTEITFAVEGLVCESCSAKVTAALGKIAGVKVESVSPEAGRAVLKYDPAKVQPAQLIKAIAASGYKVTGEVVSFKVTGLQNDAAASAVEKVLLFTDGVQRIETVCQKSGAAIVVFDPAKTDRDKIAQAMNTTKFKVAP